MVKCALKMVDKNLEKKKVKNAEMKPCEEATNSYPKNRKSALVIRNSGLEGIKKVLLQVFLSPFEN